MENIKLSVIIPVYNVQEYLVECLESVYALGKISKEVILINDGSTDDSLIILENYKRKYPLQTKVINQHNQGLSAARNAGIKIAQGAFILFLDSDDTVDKNPIPELLKYAHDNDLDLLQGVATKFGDSPKERLPIPEEVFNSSATSGRDFLKKYSCSSSLAKMDFRPEVWLLLVKRELFIDNDIRFTEGMYFEDELMTPTLYLHAKKVKSLNVPFYNYRIRKGSIMRSTNEKHTASKAVLVKKYYSLLSEKGFHHSFLSGRLIGWCRESSDYLSLNDITKLYLLRKYTLKDFALLNLLLLKKIMSLGRFKKADSVLNIDHY